MAGLGAASREWQALGEASLLALQPDLATAAFQRAHDPRMLYAAACLASKKAQGLPKGCLHAYCLALLVSFQRSSQCTAWTCSVRTLRHVRIACRQASEDLTWLNCPLKPMWRAKAIWLGHVRHGCGVQGRYREAAEAYGRAGATRDAEHMRALLEQRVEEAAAMVLSTAGNSGSVTPSLQPDLTPRAGQSSRLATATGMSGGYACSCSAGDLSEQSLV